MPTARQGDARRAAMAARQLPRRQFIAERRTRSRPKIAHPCRARPAGAAACSARAGVLEELSYEEIGQIVDCPLGTTVTITMPKRCGNYWNSIAIEQTTSDKEQIPC